MIARWVAAHLATIAWWSVVAALAVSCGVAAWYGWQIVRVLRRLG